MIITALDMSLVATGWASNEPKNWRVDDSLHRERSSGVLTPPKTHDRGMRRLRWLRDSVTDLARESNLVVIEGYAYGAKGKAVINLGELGGVIRLALSDAGRCWVEIPPACVKLFATGKGNAKKDDVYGAAIRKLGYAGNDHNEADALWLLDMTQAVYAGRELTDYQQRAVSKVAWPR
jgi:crossover junction endodeoxyribonuclease RuvC